MEKRYQVFVSSTFTDLKDERQAVLRAVLELDHMPAGMELFPAADATAWQIITDVIDASDYYLLVIGGRYGSLDEEGISFTEKEYDYATSQKKPVVPFLHQDPDNLPRGKTETDTSSWERLKAFRAKVEKRHTIVHWASAEDLKAKVIVGLTSAMKRSPAVGWIRADKVPTEATVTEILALRKRIADLQVQLEKNRISPPIGTEDLVQGSDVYRIPCNFVAREKTTTYPYNNDTPYDWIIAVTWDEIFAAIAPTMIHETTDNALREALEQFFRAKILNGVRGLREMKGRTLAATSVASSELDTCLIQFRALGLIQESSKPRSVKDTQTYWTLTPYGDQHMTQLRAMRRAPRRVEVRDNSGEAGSAQGANGLHPSQPSGTDKLTKS